MARLRVNKIPIADFALRHLFSLFLEAATPRAPRRAAAHARVAAGLKSRRVDMDKLGLHVGRRFYRPRNVGLSRHLCMTSPPGEASGDEAQIHAE